MKDIIEGRDINADGDTINTVPYAERIARGKAAHAALREFDIAKANGDKAAMDAAHTALKADYQFFGYGYMDSVEEAIPNIPLVFYSFHIMVILGSFLFAVLIFVLLLIYKKKEWLTGSWLVQWLCIVSIPLVWICSQAGWITAEVGRQPWVIQDLMPARAAISDISAGSVQLTFTLFAILFTCLLVAEVSIMLHQISKKSKTDILNANH